MNGSKRMSMKRYIKYLFVPVILSAAGCMQIEEEQFEERELVPMTFKAVMEGDQTKTSLGGEVGDSHRNLNWLPTDEIAVYRYEHNYGKFTNLNKEASEMANFTGEGIDRGTYYAVYPYSLVESWGWYENEPRINIPLIQTYAQGTFATDMNPMVARTVKTEVMEFKNLCGLLVVNLKGSERVKTVSLAAYDAAGMLARIAGSHLVDLNYESEPVLTVIQDNEQYTQGNMITMDCGQGVQLNPSVATPFHFVLAPGSYSRISILVTTTDGKTMIKEGRNPLTVNRAQFVKTGELNYAESVSVDLSEIGAANCYIVSKAGAYSFDADKIGIGEFGLVEGANFHTTNTAITPSSAELLWEDRNGVITAVSYKDKRISFLATGQEGNAVIAAKDDAGNIIWSWHVWVTDQPAEQVYVNEKGTFTMLDRNIGATRADRGTGEEYRQSEGLRYQWGRKDPYAQNKYNYANTQLSISESIQLPTTLAHGNYPWAKNWDRNFWSPSQKTIYDPCPVGYRVPAMDVWYGFSNNGDNVDRITDMNVSGDFDYGLNFYYDGTNTAWYPATGYASSWWEAPIDRGRLWSSENDGGGHSYYLNYYYASELEAELYIRDHSYGTYHGFAVRCMKDEGHVDTSYPTVKVTAINNISSTGATIVSKVTDEGVSGVTERGIVWGTSADVTKETGEVMTSAGGFGEYSITLSDLSHSVRYYVRAYAINERGISYSEAMQFYTPYEGDAVNLSKNGTANCYIVPVAYSKYVFDASVKGNSTEPVGEIASVEVLWETRNDRNPINVGAVINPETVVLEGSNVHFELPFEPKPGNALIAVKDAMGTILWSWHIWVTDYDPVATQQTYNSGAVMMDRNLGALNMIPGDYGALGLKYQWGRKDPFVGALYTGEDHVFTAPSDAIRYEYYNSSVDTMENAVKNPAVVYNDARWGDVTDLWDYKKTKYDPCPVGWRVSDFTAWEGLDNWSGCEDYLTAYTPTSTVYFPTAGYSNGSKHINNVRCTAGFWFTEYRRCILMWWDQMPYMEWNDVDYLFSVRCMKDDPTQDGSNEGYTGSDYEW